MTEQALIERDSELFEPGEYLDQKAPGYFSILAKDAGQTQQQSYELQHLPAVVRGVNPERDTYITQAIFNAPNRRACNVKTVALLFVDLDTYNRAELAHLDPERQAEKMVAFCVAEGLPPPSVIVFSGGGLHAKWFLSEALGRERLPDWNRVQQALVKAFQNFGSDQNARDISRVLRLDRTVNTKRNEVARVVFVSDGANGSPVRYAFTEIAETVQPWQEPAEPSQSLQRSPRTRLTGETVFLYKRLAWTRLYDLQTLWELRGGVPEGYREITLFWELNFLLLAEPGLHRDIWREAQTLAGNIDSSPGWYRQSDLGTLYRKAKEMVNGDGTTFQGRRYPSLYTPRNTTLIERFRITPDEERNLKTIISKHERNRRRREKRWQEGSLPREKYEADSAEKNRPWEALGMSRATWYRRK